MGTSSSTINVGKTLHSLLSDAPLDDESIALLISFSLSDTELEQAVPFPLLRYMRHYYTSNFAHLLHKTVEVIANLVQKSTAGHDVQGDVPKLHSALRLLRRLMPIAMEGGDTVCEEAEAENKAPGETDAPSYTNAKIGELNEKDQELEAMDGVSSNRLDSAVPKTEKRSRTSFTEVFVESFFVNGLACDESQRERPLPPLAGQQEQPLGTFLCQLLLDCCFLRGLTLPVVEAVPGTNPNTSLNSSPTNESSHAFVDEALLWYPGVGSTVSPTSGKALGASASATVHATRYELLATLVTFLAYPMFFPPGTRDRIFTEPLLNVYCVLKLPQLVASALNAVLSYKPFSSIPYMSHWAGAEEKVIVASLDFLCAVLYAPGVLLEEKSEPTEVTVTETKEDAASNGESSASRPKPRVIHSARKVIHDILPTEAQDILIRLQPMMGLKLYSYQTVSPDSQRRLRMQDQLMMLFWRLIDLSPEFREAFSRDKIALRYLLPMVDYALDAQRNLVAFSHLQLVVFLLLRLSEHRSFCLLCNTPFDERIPFEFDSNVDSYGDLLLLMLSTFLLMRQQGIRPLHGACSAIISNISYFLTNIGPTASKKLTLIFTSAATRCLAYAAIKHAENAETRASVTDAEVAAEQVVMVSIVEAMASALQYHERGAVHLLTNLITQRKLISDVEKAFTSRVGGDPPRVHSILPFLIETLSAAVKDENGLTTLVGVLSTPHPIVVKKMHNTPELEQWSLSTLWSSLYVHSPPGTFGDCASIKFLRFP